MKRLIFRAVLPDLGKSIEDYLNNPDKKAAINFMQGTGLGRESRPRGLTGVLRDWLGNSRHFWMWDEKALISELETAGFCQCRRALFGDADDPAFLAVEDEGRWEDCLGIECRKPDSGGISLKTSLSIS